MHPELLANKWIMSLKNNIGILIKILLSDVGHVINFNRLDVKLKNTPGHKVCSTE
jgi:hypothetical protein